MRVVFKSSFCIIDRQILRRITVLDVIQVSYIVWKTHILNSSIWYVRVVLFYIWLTCIFNWWWPVFQNTEDHFSQRIVSFWLNGIVFSVAHRVSCPQPRFPSPPGQETASFHSEKGTLKSTIIIIINVNQKTACVFLIVPVLWYSIMQFSLAY